jgi:hypothetical protein
MTVAPNLHRASRIARSGRTRHALWLASASTLAGFGLGGIAHAAAPGNFEQVSALALAASGVTQSPVPSSGLPMAEQDLKVELLAGPLQPVLSAGLIGSQHSVKRGAPAHFLGYSNYPAIIAKDELRLYPAGRTPGCEPSAVVRADCNGVMSWTPDERAPAAMEYVYRVYDQSGRFDETAPQPLTLLPNAHAGPLEPAAREDFGIVDAAAVRGIGFDDAATVRISGSAPADTVLRVSRQITPLEADGSFSALQIVPGDCRAITLDVTGGCGQIRSSQVPRGEWAARLGESTQHISAETARPGAAPSDGLSIDMDAEPAHDANPYRIEVRTDAIHLDPVLAVGLAESERSVVAGQPATFVSYTNYASFIARREVRIFRAADPVDGAPVEVVEADKDGVARWQASDFAGAELFYVYRVYDAKGRYDETAPQELSVLATPFASAAAPQRPLFGSRDEAARRNIPLQHGVTVTVTGQASAADEMVRVSGQMVPLETDGRFVSQQIVARTSRQVWVTVGRDEQARFTAVRDIEAPRSDWFIVGQGDLTFVSNRGKGAAVEVSGSPIADGDHLVSRAAFYAKGSLANGVTVTSSLDTGETLLRDLFSNIDRKDPRQLLRRMDTNQYYATYGDDSTLVEDAPTQGRFYLKVQKDRSSLLVGNFVADIQQAELAQLNRGIFGAIADHKSLGVTSFGEARLSATAFASDPGTIPGRDEFRGTGGSLYFLKRRDLTVGSERLSVEVRDRDTGLVLSRRDLVAQEDYDIDYFQGRVTLLRPLASTADADDLVRQGSGSGNIPVLVARYEYSPAVGDVSGYTVGGRASTWLGDVVRLGVTGQRETTDSADQTLLGADVMVRAHAGTYVKAEVAQSEGPGFGVSNSVDGGLSFTDRLAAGRIGQKARAWRGEAAVDLAELRGLTGKRGKATAFFEHFDAGFSANAQLTQNETRRWGVTIDAPFSARTSAKASFERLDTATIGRRTVASAEVAQKLGRDFTLKAGFRHDEQAIGLMGNSTEAGQRSDGVVQVELAPAGKVWSLHAFGQATLDRDATRRRNNRGGLGGKLAVSDRVSAAAEISGGDGGLGANVELSHRYGDGSETYLGYALVADRTDLGLEPQGAIGLANRGTLTIGARHRFSSSLGVHGENKIGHGGPAPSVMRSFGLDWNPSEKWSYSATFENGHVDNEDTGLFRRTAMTFGLGYTTEKLQLATNVEGRFEKGAARDQKVWLFRNTASVALSRDWRALGRLNFAIADEDRSDVRAADFVEGTMGFAYRPVMNDRLNLLARYTYLKDMGPVGQVTEGGETASPRQKSQIFSLDVNYDLTPKLTLGGKYAFRTGAVSLGRDSEVFVSSRTQLAVLRTDWRVVKAWDVTVEGHYLSNDRGGDRRLGGLAAVYRHLNNNVKVGVGYSFSDFSSDLGDQSYSSRGYFLNLLGKF